MIISILFILLQSAPYVWCSYNQVSVQQVCFKDSSLNTFFYIDSVASRHVAINDRDSVRFILLGKNGNDIRISEWKEDGCVMAAFFKDKDFLARVFNDKDFDVIGIGNSNSMPIIFLGSDSFLILKRIGKRRRVILSDKNIRPYDEGLIPLCSCFSVDDWPVWANAYVYREGQLHSTGVYDINRHTPFPELE